MESEKQDHVTYGPGNSRLGLEGPGYIANFGIDGSLPFKGSPFGNDLFKNLSDYLLKNASDK
jgi:hypothetical protein